MKKYSWYTNPVKVTDYLTVYQYAVDREIFLEKRKDGSTSFILIKKGTYVTRHDGGWQRYKPNLKGGHTHNHVFNAVNRHTFRNKKQRLKAKNRKSEIKTLTSEVKALREMNARAQEEIATLKENQRWRKYPDEKPTEVKNPWNDKETKNG